jgi:hypothetical protein
MTHVSHYQIGGIGIRINSDVRLPTARNRIFDQFLAQGKRIDADFSFTELKRDSLVLNDLDSNEKASLRRTLHFPERWLTNPVFRSPAVRHAIRRMQNNPELSHLSLSWNRMIVRNFARNEFFYFYHSANKSEISNPLFNARFRNLIGLSYANNNRMLLHGAGAITDHGGLLFLAPDEGGKTTLIKKFAPAEILGDDQVVLDRQGEYFHLHSTPFGSMTCGPAKARLKAIFLIKKSRKFQLERSPANEALRLIWSDALSRLTVLPKEFRINIFNMVFELCQQIPCYLMHTPIDSINFDAIEKVSAL